MKRMDEVILQNSEGPGRNIGGDGHNRDGVDLN